MLVIRYLFILDLAQDTGQLISVIPVSNALFIREATANANLVPLIAEDECAENAGKSAGTLFTGDDWKIHSIEPFDL